MRSTVRNSPQLVWLSRVNTRRPYNSTNVGARRPSCPTLPVSQAGEPWRGDIKVQSTEEDLNPGPRLPRSTVLRSCLSPPPENYRTWPRACRGEDANPGSRSTQQEAHPHCGKVGEGRKDAPKVTQRARKTAGPGCEPGTVRSPIPPSPPAAPARGAPTTARRLLGP
ncbi:uncharacterized protein LOC110192608 [Phascolarctos cinereus]